MHVSTSIPPLRSPVHILFSIIGLLGGGILIAFFFGVKLGANSMWLTISLSAILISIIGFSLISYLSHPEGIKNDGVWFNFLTNRGLLAWAAGIVITGFYVLLYWFPTLLGMGENGSENSGLIALFDPLSQLLKGQPASQWFVYGALYTLAILTFGFKFILKYRHNKYQLLRTISVMFFQTGFAFLLPEFLIKLNYPYYDFKNMWPLNYYFFDEWTIKGFLSAGNIGLLMIIFGIAMIFIISPILTYYFGKRWYCSWVCGCGGLAETAGDSFRHLSDKRLSAWKLERWLIHAVLIFAILMTIAVLYALFHNNPEGFWVNKTSFLMIVLALGVFSLYLLFFEKRKIRTLKGNTRKIVMGVILFLVLIPVIAHFSGSGQAFFIDKYQLYQSYGFLIGAAFSGVIGVGFYPILGSRVWCRFGCPMAAILGIQQKFFSRFRITTNGGQCISCGNCSTYCEMGIDVRSYAQKGQNIVRASCVGCGICAAVCPRGVLRLENGTIDILNKTSDLRTVHVKAEDVTVLN